MGEPEPAEQEQSMPLALGKDKKRKKLDEIVFGLSAAKGQNVFAPPAPSPKGQQQSVPQNMRSPATSRGDHHRERDRGDHHGMGLNLAGSPFASPSSSQKRSNNSHNAAANALANLFATPTSSAGGSSHSASKDAHQSMQNLLNNPLLSATLNLFKNAGTDLKELTKLAQASANLAAVTSQSNTSAGKKDQGGRSQGGGQQQGSSSHLPEIPKYDLSKLAEMAVPKFDLFSQDAKVNKWLAEHADFPPERPPSPEFMDGRRRRRPRVDPLLLDWNKLNGDENVTVIHRVNGKKVRVVSFAFMGEMLMLTRTIFFESIRLRDLRRPS